MDVGLADPFCPAYDSAIRNQGGASQRLRMSPTCISFDGDGSSWVEPQEKVVGSDPVGGNEEVKIDLDDEPGSLLNSLNT